MARASSVTAQVATPALLKSAPAIGYHSSSNQVVLSLSYTEADRDSFTKAHNGSYGHVQATTGSLFNHLRTLKTRHYTHLLLRAVLRPRAAAVPVVQQSIDVLPGRAHSSKPAARCYSGRMGQTDGRTPYRL